MWVSPANPWPCKQYDPIQSTENNMESQSIDTADGSDQYLSYCIIQPKAC